MNSTEIHKSISEMKVLLNRGEKNEHWFNFAAISFFLGCIGYVFLKETIDTNELSYPLIVVLGLFLLLIRHKLLSQNLQAFKATINEEQFKQANQAAAKLNEWSILVNTKTYFSAVKHVSWQWGGIKITAIKKDNKLYLNSMVNPATNSNPFTFGLNKKNTLELIKQYQLVKSGKDVDELVETELSKREEQFWSESEWTLKNMLIRIIGYLFVTFFIIISIILIAEGEIQTYLYGFFIIAVCVGYVYYDAKVIIEKNRKKYARL